MAFPRRLRGVIGNAVVWGALWFTVILAVSLASLLARGHLAEGWLNTVQFSLRGGVMGGIAGTAFSSFIAWRYRGRRLADISWLKFGLGGGIVTALFIPLFLAVARALSGDAPLPFNGLVSNASFGFVFGAIAAAASIKLAQIADRYLPSGTFDRSELAAGSEVPTDSTERERESSKVR